jgi:hypothetical protein
MTAVQKRALIKRIRRLWREHDAKERAILRAERKLDDNTLRRIGAAGA